MLEAAVFALRSDRGLSDDMTKCLPFGVVRAVTFKCPEAAARAASAGCIEPALLGLSSRDMMVRQQCLNVLTELGLDRGGAHALVRGGVVARVAAAMRDAPAHFELQSAGITALNNLVCYAYDGASPWPPGERARAALAPHFAAPLSAALAHHPNSALSTMAFTALTRAHARLCEQLDGEAHRAFVAAAVAAGLRGAVEQALCPKLRSNAARKAAAAPRD